MSLRTKVLSGLFWSGGTRLLSQALTWAITIVVIRLLSPGDYGLLAMATVFIGLLALLAEAGLGSALVQAPELDDVKLRRVFGAVILVDLALFVLQFAAAPLIAGFFEEDRLVAIIRVLALQFPLMIFTVIPGALLSRRLDFKRASMIGLASSVCGGLSSLALALSGYGVWALVLSSLVVSVFNVVAFNVAVPFLRRPDFSFKGMRSLIVFGGQFTASRVLWFLYSQADVFIAGKLLGKELLGFYSISMHLASLPVQKISAVVNGVAYPAFAEAQHKPETIPGHMLKAVRMLSFVSFPVLWGISSIAPEIVAVLLGPKWQAAVMPLQLLPLVMPITMLSPFMNTAFQGIGRGGIVLRNVFTAFLVMPAAFWIGSRWGLLGLSMAWLIGFPIVFLVNLRRMLPLVGLKVRDVLAAIAPPALAAAGMYACVSIVRQLLGRGLPEPALMALLITAGAAAYAAITLATNGRGMREAVDLFRKGPAEGGRSRLLGDAVFRFVGDLLSPAGERGRLSILIYHRALAAPDPILCDEIDAATFERHMALLAAEFNVLPLGEACTRLARGALPARAACVTFDDGYADNEQTALPILKRLGLPATFFVSTGFSEGGIMFNDGVIEAVRRAPGGTHDLSRLGLGRHDLGDNASRRAAIDALLGQIKYRPVGERGALVERLAEALQSALPHDLMMRPAQIRRLHDEGMEIGGHTVNHPILAVLDDKQARAEIVGGKHRLEEITGAPVTLFAYPNGKPGRDYAPRHVEMVRQAGFAAALSTTAGVAHRGSDRFQLPRFSPWDRNARRLGARLLASCFRAVPA